MSNRARKTKTGTSQRTLTAKEAQVQSDVLTGTVGMLLAVKAVWLIWQMHRFGVWPPYPLWLKASLAGSLAFAVAVRLLRSATSPAALMGFLVCVNLLLGQIRELRWYETPMPALMALFALTFVATRFGRSRKERMGVAETRQGRRASQILANLGVAGLCSGGASPVLFAACVAALAEATADTVSSEMGQALGGRTLLLTSWKEVPAGTDGGISVWGTTLGAAGAGIIVLVTAFTGRMSVEVGLVSFAAGVAGLLFDSLLGATLERWGWLGNDWVNFASTMFAAIAGGIGMMWVS
ncbi:MAG TPA: DUF92 domain-containing protein [Granulicella sp.]